jgi:thioredoxin 1
MRTVRHAQGVGQRHAPSTAERAFAVVVVLVAILLVLALKHATRNTTRGPDRDDPAAMVPLEPIPASYASSAPGIPRLAALGAGECIPCKAMAPIRAELRREYAGALVVDFYDVWKDPAAGRHFRIRAIPTLIFYDAEGREVGRLLGFVPKADILAAYARWGVVLRPPRS